VWASGALTAIGLLAAHRPLGRKRRSPNLIGLAQKLLEHLAACLSLDGTSLLLWGHCRYSLARIGGDRSGRCHSVTGRTLLYVQCSVLARLSIPARELLRLGLGADLAMLRRICAEDKEALDEIDKATAGRQGERTDLVSNRNKVTAERPVGTT